MPESEQVKHHFTIAVFLLVASLYAPAHAREQVYEVPLTDFALVRSIGSFFEGDPLAEGFAQTRSLDGIDILKMLKQFDFEFTLRARPAWRADGDRAKHSKGFYECRIYLWEQVGPLAALDYRLQFFGGHGASTRIKSHIEIDVRRFGPRHGDRLILAVANIPIVHRLINRVAERAVHAAEFGLIHGYALADHARRDREREERRKSTGGVE